MMRSAIGCTIACGAFVMGPLSVGAACASADLLGTGGGSGVDVLGIDLLGGGKAKRSGDGVSGPQSHPSAVSTVPSARSVVIRTKTPTAQSDLSVRPASFTAPIAAAPAVAQGFRSVEAIPAAPPPAAPPMPMIAPLTAPVPAAPVIGQPVPEGMPISTTKQPGPSQGIGPATNFSPPSQIPASFRVGYAEYLRSATTSDILAAALPGAAGLAGFTLAGAYAGYRQAKAVQMALLAPVPTRIVL